MAKSQIDVPTLAIALFYRAYEEKNDEFGRFEVICGIYTYIFGLFSIGLHLFAFVCACWRLFAISAVPAHYMNNMDGFHSGFFIVYWELRTMQPALRQVA